MVRSMFGSMLLATVFVALTPFFVSAAGDSDLHFAPDGTITAKNIVIYQKAGTNLFCRAVWGQAFIRFVVTTNVATSITKNHGEKATIGDINEKDVIDLDGALSTGADSMVIVAKSIRDSALQSADKTISGAVVSVNAGMGTFVVNDKTFGKVTVAVSGAAITKGARSISISDIKAGDKILSAPGSYDYTTSTLTASSVVVYQDGSVFLPRNFEGTLKSISGTTLPITLVVTVGGIDYTIYVPQGSSVLNTAKKNASLSRFVVGDSVRFYGVIRPANLTEVDVQVLRDLNF